MTTTRSILAGLFLFLCLGGGPAAAADPVTFKDGERKWTYEKLSIHGWTVYLQLSIAKDDELKKKIEAQIRIGLENFLGKVPQEALTFLRTIPIWVSNEPGYPHRENENGVIPFHRSPQWLRDHNLNPHMAPGVHVINPEAVFFEHKFLEWGPMTFLHELAHAYQNVKLKLNHKSIRSAYRSAMKEGLYLQVPSRRDKSRKVKAYAATNHEEYFAELTEAYFGHNDWFPHNREELREYDPRGFKMIEEVWSAEAFK
ncbi:MAG: hypothetical protein HRU37_13520 [Roseibacillus sp.]|nr:hypothetical protein [Roseibacillus sp.]